ncbi:IBR finger domain-containing protein [Aspergillus heteromorphus CBS 117.55]|uniref:RBR-type E3 ubiquitin transferase n=1 Tax=Aspergillus heteromorphus CBS 117.55 TaxID=1448321 RepID=A0A317UXB3_9EURO|nr:IBR finger domain-containing protein [Aspergillus heteromorphus CBS 117.55]PWY65969.1 IBR finger domain-containing protein [Aspergillus heteromorphus CBS 117.55]
MAGILQLEMDQASADLIIQLQLEDASEFFRASKGKSRDQTDEELAFRLQTEELEDTDRLFYDRRMATSMAAAVRADGKILAEVSEEDQGTAGNGMASHGQSSLERTILDEETLWKLQIQYISGWEEGYNDASDIEDEDSNIGLAESSNMAARRHTRSSTLMRRCIACGEETELWNVARAPCRHEYCRSCLKALFETSMADESLFPPRCCKQTIDINMARIFLKPDVIQQYERKKVEFETHDRTYCHSSQCSAFIGPSYISGAVATCPDCGHTTCTECKKPAHTGDCPSDTEMQQLLATAEQKGWQRCLVCWRVVERMYGCNHATIVVPAVPNSAMSVEGPGQNVADVDNGVEVIFCNVNIGHLTKI